MQTGRINTKLTRACTLRDTFGRSHGVRPLNARTIQDSADGANLYS